MRIVDKLTRNRKKYRMTLENEINTIKYDMPLKARIVLEGVTALTMVLSPLLWVYTVVVVSLTSLWGSLVELPLEVRQRIMVEFVKNGVAKRRVNETEPNK